MRIGLIVADIRHLKTAQVIQGLHAKGERDLTIYTVPFVHRKSRSPIFQHRPYQFDAPDPRELASSYNGVSYEPLTSLDYLPADREDLFLMTGGILIPESKLTNETVRFLNVHAGLIPEVRGLDAFKWAILKQAQLGVTLHEIDARVDMGKILVRENTPIFEDDTLHTLAMRHYLAEIDLLVNSVDFLDAETYLADRTLDLGPAHMRMKARDEAKLDAAFVQYKQKFSEKRSPN